MNYFEKFDAQKEKLDNLMEEHHLLAKFNTTSYPITLYVMQNQTPDSQMALYSTESDGVSSSDAKLMLTFPIGGKADIGLRIYGRRLVISNGLMNKIKNIGLKMRDLWQQGEFASRMEAMGAVAPDAAEDRNENEGAEE